MTTTATTELPSRHTRYFDTFERLRIKGLLLDVGATTAHRRRLENCCRTWVSIALHPHRVSQVSNIYIIDGLDRFRVLGLHSDPSFTKSTVGISRLTRSR